MIGVFLKSVRREGLGIALRKALRVFPTIVKQYLSRLPATLVFLRLWLLKTVLPRGKDRTIRLHGFVVHYHDLKSLFVEYKDIFYHGIYGFVPTEGNSDPFIIDGGGFIGLSVLYFKYIFPRARILVFEPSHSALKFLLRNIKDNNLQDVTIVEKGIGLEEARLPFSGSATDAGRLDSSGSEHVDVVPLSTYITNTVDFVKLNIEGAELSVLRDLEFTQAFSFIDQMVIEWHSFKGEGQDLHKLLQILARNGFHYLVNHFDYVTNKAVKPPFHIDADTQYYLLVYAKRKDLID